MVEKSTLVEKTEKRQPTKLPLSRVTKSVKKPKTATTQKKESPKKTSVKKASTKKSANRKSVAKKSAAQKSTATTQSKTRKSKVQKRAISIWFGPSYTLEIKLSPVTKKPAKKNNKLAKKLNLNPRTKAVLIMFVGLMATGYFLSNLFSTSAPPAVYSAPAPIYIPDEAEQVNPLALAPSRPTSLQISSVDIETDLSVVGRNPDDTLTVPTEFDIAGWYEYSPTPGELGPAIITGHVDSYNGPAVFWRLGQVKIGDTIDIAREDGTVVTFEVEQVKQFEQDNFPTEEVYGNIDYIGLRLITCGGVWDRSAQSYSHNTVVFARLLK